YENRRGRREQVEEYIGPATDLESRERVARKVAAYAERAKMEMGRFVELARSEMATSRLSASSPRYRYSTITRSDKPSVLRSASLGVRDVHLEEVLGHADILEDLLRIVQDGRRVLISRTEVREDQQAHPGLLRGLRGLPGG